MSVTVLMPVFNRARFIDEAVTSVLQQEYEQFELVMVDDGSTDETPAILARWQRDDPRVVVVTSPQNEGIPAALNRGLAVARGEYTARLDSDDVMMPGRLAAQAEVLDENRDVSLVSSAIELINVDGEHRGTWRGDEPHEVMMLLLNFFNVVGGGGQVMFRTAEVRELGGYAERYPSSEDYDLWTRLLQRGRIVTLPTIGMKMRDHPDRSMTKYRSIKRANWHGILGASLRRYLDRVVEPAEIDALIALWQLDGSTGLAARAEATMREAFAVFRRNHREQRLHRIAAIRIAEQWRKSAKSFEVRGEGGEAVIQHALSEHWWQDARERGAAVSAGRTAPLIRSARRVTARDVVMRCVTGNTPQAVEQAMRLLESIRRFGGELAGSRVIVCIAEAMAPEAKSRLESMGAQLTTMRSDETASYPSRTLTELWDGPERVLLSLESNTLIAGDPLPFLSDDAFQAKVAPAATVTDQTFARLFARHGLPLPEKTFLTGYSGEPTIPYFNTGVMAMPREIAARLFPEWRRHATALSAEPEVLGPSVAHLTQAALTLALASSGVRIRELPVELDFEIHLSHLATPARYLALDPVVVHYEQGSEGERISAPMYPHAQEALDRFYGRES